MSFDCAYHAESHDGEPFMTRTYDCAQHGPEVLRYCEAAATWLGLIR